MPASRLLPSASRTVRPSAPATAGRNRTPAIRSRRRLLPVTKSGRARSQRPSRDPAVTRIRPSRVSHQNKSLPASRCGSTGALVAIARSTWRVAASSPAIWNPELPPLTTRTGPGGNVRGHGPSRSSGGDPPSPGPASLRGRAPRSSNDRPRAPVERGRKGGPASGDPGQHVRDERLDETPRGRRWHAGEGVVEGLIGGGGYALAELIRELQAAV